VAVAVAEEDEVEVDVAVIVEVAVEVAVAVAEEDEVEVDVAVIVAVAVEDEVAVPVGRFQFRQAAFDWAVQRIEQSLGQAGSVVIDEVGPLELRNGGFAALLDRLERDYPATRRVLLVRSSLVDAVTGRFCRGAATIFDPDR
jgi:hypothetical protein